MPSISAPEMLAGFTSDGRNVSLPGILTGAEALVLVDRMPRHTALFVIEEHPWQVKLALRLRDYSHLLASGRLVFIVGSDLEERMREFFGAHPGYEPPTRMLSPPQRSPAQIAELQRRLENTGEEALRVSRGFAEACAARIASRTAGAPGTAPRVAILSFDVQPGSIQQCARVRRALEKLQLAHEVCIPDTPRNSHVAAHLNAIDRLPADLVLMINSPYQGIARFLPPHLPVVCWYLPGTSSQPPPPQESSSCTLLFTSCDPHGEMPRHGGAQACSIRYIEPGADNQAYYPTHGTPGGAGRPAIDVVILMDVPDDRAEACDTTLSSHLILWRAIRQLLGEAVDTWTADQAAELVDRAQRASGVTLADPAIREHFAGLARARIAPACRARAVVAVVSASTRRFATWGLNWHLACDHSGVWRGAGPFADQLNDLFNSTRIVVLPDYSPTALQHALDALAAGARVVCHAPDQPFERAHPTLITLQPYLHLFRTRRELRDTLKSLLSQSTGGDDDDTTAARAIVLEKHCVSDRLQVILNERARLSAAFPNQER
ncbi:MAG: hypothetical protein ACE5HE_07780 [Phycisphaerae bacterium]